MSAETSDSEPAIRGDLFSMTDEEILAYQKRMGVRPGVSPAVAMDALEMLDRELEQAMEERYKDEEAEEALPPPGYLAHLKSLITGPPIEGDLFRLSDEEVLAYQTRMGVPPGVSPAVAMAALESLDRELEEERYKDEEAEESSPPPGYLAHLRSLITAPPSVSTITALAVVATAVAMLAVAWSKNTKR